MAKILVIDDDPMIVDLLKMQLTEWGHQVSVATDAYSAMTVAARDRPGLITLDFQMPAGDGGQVYQRLRGNTFTSQTPILFISAVDEEKVTSAAAGDPGVRYLQKPIDREAFRRLVSEMLGIPLPPASKPVVEDKTIRLDGGAFGGDILDTKLPPAS
ncbi:MAG: response regulator [Elusimicrobiota bacterium]